MYIKSYTILSQEQTDICNTSACLASYRLWSTAVLLCTFIVLHLPKTLVIFIRLQLFHFNQVSIIETAKVVHVVIFDLSVLTSYIIQILILSLHHDLALEGSRVT